MRPALLCGVGLDAASIDLEVGCSLGGACGEDRRWTEDLPLWLGAALEAVEVVLLEADATDDPRLRLAVVPGRRAFLTGAVLVSGQVADC